MLRVHSHFSLLRGTASVEALAARAAADGLPALALADHDALYGAVALRRACAAHGLKPVIGMTVRVAWPEVGRPGTLVLLARNPAGYRALCRLSSRLQDAADREARLAAGLGPDVLVADADGLIAIDGGVDGALRAAPDGRAYVVWLRETYRDAYLGVADDAAAAAVTAFQPAEPLPLVALRPVYTLERDPERLRLLTAIRLNVPLADVPAAELPPALSQWRAPAETAAALRGHPGALANVGRILDRCEPALPDGRTLWPALELPAGQSADGALRDQAEAGLAARFPDVDDATRAAIRRRLAHELVAIGRHGFAPLFLVVADIVAFARRERIPVSTRGSVANSLVAYCLRITTVDPIATDLLFERFLNPARATLPDIDLDFCSRRRDRVLDYVRGRYGADRVALVATVNTFKRKSAVRAAAKAYGYDEARMAELSRKLPGRWHPDPRRRERVDGDQLLDRFQGRDRQVVKAALGLVGLPDHLSVHPGGVVITPGPLTDVVPLQWTPKGFSIVQFDHRDVEPLGLPKIDLLGIRALTVLADAAEKVRAGRDLAFDVEAIPAADRPTGDMLQRGDTVGVFQCESSGAQRTLRQLQARNVTDLAVANAFFKPGPATGGMAAEFVRRYRGEAPVRYLHPALEPILGSTKGVLLFQEQILRVAREIAGLSWADADQLRKGMSKFDAAAMAALQTAFETGCRRQSGFSAAQARTLWTQVLAFAGYGFNQGHATAYAAVSYRSAYVKAHYPAEFMWARLAVGGGFHHPAINIAEARRLGIDVRPPHVNHSDRAFTLGAVDGRPTLWTGLGWVRDLRRRAVRAIAAARPFRDLRDLLLRVDLQGKEIDHLIKCGALDGLGPSRAALLAEAQTLGRAGAGQLSFAFAAAAVPDPETARQRFDWERALLGLPLSVHPVDLVPGQAGDVSLADLPAQRGKVTILAARLPGWTGGDGFFIGDRTGYAIAMPARDFTPPPRWTAVRLVARWRPDRWGGGGVEVEREKEKGKREK